MNPHQVNPIRNHSFRAAHSLDVYRERYMVHLLFCRHLYYKQCVSRAANQTARHDFPECAMETMRNVCVCHSHVRLYASPN